MKVCCDNGKPVAEMSDIDRLACNHDHCAGPIDIDDFDLLLTGLGTFDTQDCISVEDLWKIVEQEKEKK